MSPINQSVSIKTGSDACPFLSVGQETDAASRDQEHNKSSTNKSGGCPFAKMAKDEMNDMMAQIPSDHPSLVTTNKEYEVTRLNSSLNNFLPETHVKKSQDYLTDPQLASAMKESTKIVHRAAEESVFTKRFMKGSINKDEYGRYINSLYFVYETMEELLNQHKENPIIQTVYFPSELSRKDAICKDLEYYYGKERIPELTNIKNITPAVQNYIQVMKLAAEKNPALLIAHSYTRYLGDLSGGQILAKRLKKHVLKIDPTDFTWDSYNGLEFYNFEHIESHAQFKDQYRKCLDNAHVSQYTKDLIVAEAIFAFELNIALFDEVQDLSDKNKLHTTTTTTTTTTIKKIGFSAPSSDWLVGFVAGAATFALGLSLYHRISERMLI